MPPLIKVAFDAFKEAEKLLKFRYGDKERERSNRAAGLVDTAKRMGIGRRPICPMRHDRIAWSGPPHDSIRAYVCLRCNAAACEPEIKEHGFDFDTVPDWIIYEVLDLDLHRQSEGSFTSYDTPAKR